MASSSGRKLNWCSRSSMLGERCGDDHLCCRRASEIRRLVTQAAAATLVHLPPAAIGPGLVSGRARSRAPRRHRAGLRSVRATLPWQSGCPTGTPVAATQRVGRCGDPFARQHAPVRSAKKPAGAATMPSTSPVAPGDRRRAAGDRQGRRDTRTYAVRPAAHRLGFVAQPGEWIQGSLRSKNSGSPTVSLFISSIWAASLGGGSLRSPSRASASVVK
jgi:hypothetical protein